MSTFEIKAMSLREKLQLMEAIWIDLREHVECLEVPPAHRDLLDSRRERIASGKSSIRGWDQVKHSIGQP